MATTKTLVRVLSETATLHRDPKTGIAWVEDTKLGCGHSAHPNISDTGSVRGMKDRGYWAKDAKTVRSHGFIFNISSIVLTDEYDRIAAQACQCGADHGC
jgi:hypothetical protein